MWKWRRSGVVETLVEVPEVWFVDRFIEVPHVHIQEIIREVPKVEILEIVQEVPKVPKPPPGKPPGKLSPRHNTIGFVEVELGDRVILTPTVRFQNRMLVSLFYVFFQCTNNKLIAPSLQ